MTFWIVLKGMAGNGSIVWLMFSILQALLAFTGVLPSEMAVLQYILGGNSIGFFIIFLYFMFKKKPKGFLDSSYDQSERTVRLTDESGNLVEVPEKSEGSWLERWSSLIWFIALISGFITIF